jgi:hypothetical protein
MNARSLIVPGLVFFAGAVFGRLFGVKPLVRGAMTVATMSGVIPGGSERRRPPCRPSTGTAARGAAAIAPIGLIFRHGSAKHASCRALGHGLRATPFPL